MKIIQGIVLSSVFAVLSVFIPQKALAAMQASKTSDGTITVILDEKVHIPRGTGRNVHQFGILQVANGEYTVKVEATKPANNTGNTLLIMSDTDHGQHEVIFSNVERAGFTGQTAPRPLLVEEGKVSFSVAVHSMLGSDDHYDGSSKVVLIPVTAPRPTQTAAVAGASTTATPQTLPQTGSNILGTFGIVSIGGYTLHRTMNKRRISR